MKTAAGTTKRARAYVGSEVLVSSKPRLSPQYLQQLSDENGYIDLREVPGQGWCGLLPFNFTWGLVVNLNESGYERRYCFEQQADARLALQSWSGSGHPGGPWIKCKGFGIDLLNPELSNF